MPDGDLCGKHLTSQTFRGFQPTCFEKWSATPSGSLVGYLHPVEVCKHAAHYAAALCFEWF